MHMVHLKETKYFFISKKKSNIKILTEIIVRGCTAGMIYIRVSSFQAGIVIKHSAHVRHNRNQLCIHVATSNPFLILYLFWAWSEIISKAKHHYIHMYIHFFPLSKVKRQHKFEMETMTSLNSKHHGSRNIHRFRGIYIGLRTKIVSVHCYDASQFITCNNSA